MSVSKYEDKPVDCSAKIDLSNLAGKSAIITGGCSGLGLCYVKGFLKAGVYVTIADLDEATGQELETQYPGKVQFVKCNVCSWEDQVLVFKSAIANSPHKSCDIVVANAGISGPDPVWQFDNSEEPVKPNLKILDINLNGVVYTSKLAMHYFRRQPQDLAHDRCLIIKGSLAGFLDQPGSPQYNISKFGGRALMRCLRRTAWSEGIRVNYVAPWYIRTPIMSDEVQKRVASKGVEFALQEDALKTVLRITSDRNVNGRALAVVPRSMFKNGYVDVEHDDYQDSDFLKGWQETVLATSHRTAVSANLQ